ncbi:cytochrome P450 [Thioclava sp. F28-4]|uniref:cytochrome P450 n=1 Tax=Thioclava sp. F28-4 TaxID=1915315 RepID=UPI0009976089|nr:cytochrome P450 [Thioclava sp. F28-4]OOY04715.1 cytochrome P450 [Thioclava sp. F28-4]
MDYAATDDTHRLPARAPLAEHPLGIFASFRAARRNLLEIIPELATHAPIISGNTGARWHMVMDPDSLRHILKTRVEDYPKSVVTKLILGPAVGEGLFVAEGAEWRWQRRAASPVFAARNMEALAPVMGAAAEASAARISIAADTGRAVDLHQEMVAATFEVISDVTFSGDEGFDRAAIHRAIDAYIAQTAKVSLLDLFALPAWVPRPHRVISSGVVRDLKRHADRAIEARRAGEAKAVPDLLDLLDGAQDPETGREMSPAELRDNLLTFIVAGHETTALTLAWALYLCAFDPEVQEAARSEAQAALGARAATVDDLPRMPLIAQIVNESLRLYPPAGFLSRTARKPDTLLGREVRAGDTVMLPIYALHRHHALWDDPHAFRPDRFANPTHDRFAFLPFGAGPRICIGAGFAMQEAQIILATLLARFRFTAVPGREPVPEMILTTRPKGGIWLTAERA